MNDMIIDNRVMKLESFITKKNTQKLTHPLTYLFWEATLRCNLNCLHCGSECIMDNSTAKDEISAEAMKRQLDLVAEKYPAKSITLAIIGGEPLIRQDIIEVGAHAANLGYNWGIVTNGILLNRKVVSQLKKAGLNTISVSLDGSEEEHNTLRNGKSYRKVVETVELLVADPFYLKFDVICCVSKININNLNEFIRDLIRLNVPAVRFLPIFSHGRASQHPEIALENADYVRLLNFIAEARESQDGIRINLGEEGYWGPEWEGVVRDRFHYCGAGIQVGCILQNGDVTGCPSASRSYIQGNIREESFVDLWENRFSVFRKDKHELFAPECDDCEHWDLCEGGGFHMLEQIDPQYDKCCLKRINFEW